MKSIEFSESELYFLLLRMKEFNKKYDNGISQSIFRKLENVFIELNHKNNEPFEVMYDCEWNISIPEPPEPPPTRLIKHCGR